MRQNILPIQKVNKFKSAHLKFRHYLKHNLRHPLQYRIGFRVVSLLLVLLIIMGTLLFLDFYYPPHLAKVNDTSVLVLDENENLLSASLSKDESWRLKVSLDEVDPLYIKMLIAYEDKRFFSHRGVDFIALLRASFQWLKTGRIISGGSSLTMQTAHLLEPRPRNLKTKIIDILRALQLEAHFSKQEILSFYLTLTPYGRNLEGIRGASLVYFGKEPKSLTAAEAAFLVAFPQSPQRFVKGFYNGQALNLRNKILDRMQTKKIFTAKEVQEAKEDPSAQVYYKLPRFAPHLTQMLIKNMNTQKTFHTTLSASLQKQMEMLMRRELHFLRQHENIAILIVDNHSHSVKAYLGAADFFNELRKGPIDMIMSFRSPGSLLKPFIYARAMDDGILHPDTLIQDVPTDFSGYSPSNFKEHCHGWVSVRDALKNSYNIPAVAVLEEIGPKRFHAFLQSFSINLKFERQNIDPTLPIALGGVGLRLWDLVNLYCSFANKGQFNKLTVLKTSPLLPPEIISPLMSPQTAFEITDILEETEAPEGFVNHKIVKRCPVAYKTGTSYGHRDAWAIGYNADYTVGVWVGRADGNEAAPNTGRTTAAPLLFKIFDVLPKDNHTLTSRYTAKNSQNLQKMSKTEMPAHLHEFKRKSKLTLQGSATLRINFPNSGAKLHLEKEGNDWKPLSMTVSGGTPPYYCFINGVPLKEKMDHPQIIWKPDNLGFYDITVIDSQGQADHINIQLQ